MTQTQPEWIAVDWGTTNLRLWLMGGDGQVIDMRRSDQGMSALSPDGFEPVLLDLLADVLRDGDVLPVVACGMVGAKQGWVEAPFTPVPCAPATLDRMIVAPTRDARLQVHILPGVCQMSPADVMRGEETQIQGFVADHPHWDGIICLPGTHSKWTHVSAGEVVSFQTFMTGELFALLSNTSLLRHSLSGGGWDDAAFDAAVEDALTRPQAIAARLFSIRADDLLHGQSHGVARAKVSGWLLGLELAATKAYWLGQDVVLVGAAALCANYQRALSSVGVTARIMDATDLTLRGLRRAYDAIKGNAT